MYILESHQDRFSKQLIAVPEYEEHYAFICWTHTDTLNTKCLCI